MMMFYNTKIELILKKIFNFECIIQIEGNAHRKIQKYLARYDSFFIHVGIESTHCNPIL